jgi:hypothetical protein
MGLLIVVWMEGFRAAFTVSRTAALGKAQRTGTAKGLAWGRQKVERAGERQGEDKGAAVVEAELERIAAEEAAAAEAAEEAELAVPAPCRGLPESTAKRMCIGAVEAGVYP